MMRILLAVFSIIITFTASAQTNEVERRIKSIMKNYGAVGVSVAVVQDTNIVYAHSFGFKNIEDSVLLNIDDQFRIASVSKMLVSKAIMQLFEKRKLSLDDDINKYLDFDIVHPEYPNVPITIRMLMCHTSSINDTQGYESFDIRCRRIWTISQRAS